MAALTAPYDARRKDGALVAYPVAANTLCFKGGLAALSAGCAQPATDTAGAAFAGVFAETADNLSGAAQPGQIAPSPGSPTPAPVGAAGALLCRVYKAGAFVFGKAGAVAADVGKPAFVVDDNTVATAATAHSVPCGFVSELIDAGHVRVRIDLAVN